MNFKKSMISVATASILAVGFVGCGSDNTSTTSNANTTQQIHTPTGTVVGTVQDTNGNPLEDVTVMVAGRTATTDAGGIYKFDNVPVTNVAGADAAVANVLSVTIVAPTGYIGATVTVNPLAQIDDAETNDVGTGNSVANGSETFIDGFLAQAGTAVLPELDCTFTGVLRDANTSAPVANTKISLDFVNGGTVAVAQAQIQNGIATSYAVSTYTVTTDANGAFSFTDMPSDSTYNYSVTDHTTVTATPFTSILEHDLNVGNLFVMPVVANDTVTPYVASVTGTIGNVAARQMLEDDVRQTFVINFAEAMSIESDKDYTDSVIIKAGPTAATMSNVGATVTIGADGKSVTIVTDNELAEATFLDINLLITDFKDASGNFIAVAAGGQLPNVGYDAVVGQVLRLQLQVYNDLNTEAPQVTVLGQQLSDDNGPKDLAAIQAAVPALSDTLITNNTALTQMNALDDNNSGSSAQVAGRLGALATALNGGTAATVTANVPRMSFTPTGSASYDVKMTRNGVDMNLQDSNITLQGAGLVGTLSTGTANANGTRTTNFLPLDVTSVTPVEITVLTAAALRPADVITFTPYDDLGYPGTPQTITLVDNVEPTTILQNAYNARGTATHTGSNTVIKYGDGAELAVNDGTLTVGTPYLPITLGLLDNLTATGIAINNIGADRQSDNTLKYELSALSTKNSSANYELTGSTTIPSVGPIDMYDATAWTAFAASDLSRSIGVAFSENVDITDVAVNALFTGYTLNNDVTINDDNATVALGADLVDLASADVMDLANNQNLSEVDFAGLKDEAGNVTSNAKVVTLDSMPPFITSATWNATSLVVTFNEKVAPMSSYPVALTGKTDANISWGGATPGAYRIFRDSNITISADELTMTFNVSDDGNATSLQGAFPSANPTYVETAYGVTGYVHGGIINNGVLDQNGNSWSNSTSIRTPQTPVFAAVDIIPNLGIALLGNQGYTRAANDINFTVTYNQPITGIYQLDGNMTDLNSTGNTMADLLANGELGLTSGLGFGYLISSTGGYGFIGDGNLTTTGTTTVTISGATLNVQNIRLAGDAAASTTGKVIIWANSAKVDANVSADNTVNVPLNNKFSYETTVSPR